MSGRVLVEAIDKNNRRYLDDPNGTFIFNACRVYEDRGIYEVVPDMVVQCMVCARKTGKDPKKVQGVLIVEGGAYIAHPDDYDLFDDGGEMGWFAVGSECIKQVPVEYRVRLEVGETVESNC
jgi:hypothetical protein